VKAEKTCTGTTAAFTHVAASSPRSHFYASPPLAVYQRHVLCLCVGVSYLLLQCYGVEVLNAREMEGNGEGRIQQSGKHSRLQTHASRTRDALSICTRPVALRAQFRHWPTVSSIISQVVVVSKGRTIPLGGFSSRSVAASSGEMRVCTPPAGRPKTLCADAASSPSTMLRVEKSMPASLRPR
jgi:hypothetical protein